VIEDFRHGRLSAFHGLPVVHFGFADPAEVPELPEDPAAHAWRVGIEDWDHPNGHAIFELFLATVDTKRVRALTLGSWIEDVPGETVGESVAELIAAADRFPELEALFVADLGSEQCEVSWIEPPDFGPVLAAFPDLRVFGMRGGTGLAVQPFGHEHLTELTLQTGGLPPRAIRSLGQCALPALTGLDLYLGTDTYDGGSTPEDFEAILAGTAFPVLRHLGVRNAEDADAFAAALAMAPVVAQLEELDLSLGDLGDQGVAALLAGQPLTHLKKLDLHHHFVSEPMEQRLREALPGVELDLGERLTARQPWRGEGAPRRFIAVTE
jgi:hypothetical protein